MVHCLLISVLMLALITKQNMCSTHTTEHDQSKISIVRSVFRDRILSSHKPSIGMVPFYKKVDLSRSRKSPSSRPPTKEECISDQFNYAILRGCLCYLFQSTGLSNGSFVSPQLEFINAEQTTCLLFTFVGDQNEIVRVEFTHFLLDPKEPPQEYPTNCRNYVRVFDSLERAELNQNDQEFVRLCGSERNLPQRVFYSAGRVIILEIHLQFHYSNPIDIRGRFEFESKETYQSGGVLVAQSICDRLFLSPDALLSHFTEKENSLPGINIHSRRGRFFSPGFPRNYPVNNSCTYYFIGTTQERVSIALTDVKLRGTKDCSLSSTDRLEVYDGAYSETARPIALCGTELPDALFHEQSTAGELVSNHDLFTLRFVTDALRLGTERGFVLSYAFTSVGSDYAADFPGLKYQDPSLTRFGEDELGPSETKGR
ncbi:hypothetical protein FGIG_08004 [Fasciola gigantica]|uniref:CUB domain-containing protein n=1 Tax=Fasciola gigantica TaxID=46835 RepID=A0A504Z613_FASGI|nr:hypothetical protein FGIG_08004 [Fasciola gigantica]